MEGRNRNGVGAASVFGGAGGVGGGIGMMGGSNAYGLGVGGVGNEGVGGGVGVGGGGADFTSLLSSSTSLLSSWNTTNQSSSAAGSASGRSGVSNRTNPSLTKNIRELGVASASLGVPRRTNRATAATTAAPSTAQPAAAATYEAEASAHRLLAREGGGFDSAHLGRSARELELRANATASVGATRPLLYSTGASHGGAATDGPAAIGTGGGFSIPPHQANAPHRTAASSYSTPYADARDVNHMLNASYSNLMKDILYTQRQATQNHAHSLINKRIMQDFNIEKHLLLKDIVGHRTLGGAHASQHASQTRSYHAHVSSPQSNYSHTTLSQSALQHANIVSALPPRSHPATPHQSIQHLLSILPPSSPDTDTVDQAYANACNLLESIIAPNNTQPPSSSYNIASRTIASLSHLADQYRNHILTKVQKASMAGRLIHSQQPLPPTDTASGLAQHVNIFVKLLSPVTMTTNTMTNAYQRATLWATLYYCLRCGDACAALITLQNAPSNIHIDPSVSSLITQLANFQSSHNEKSLFFSPTNNTNTTSGLTSAVSAQERMAVVELYHMIKTRSVSSTTTSVTNNEETNEEVQDMELMFQMASLALLSLAEPLTSSSSSTASPASNVVQTIEDYLFASLWMAVHQSPSSSSNSNSSCETQIVKLGQLLKRWGASYFEGTENPSSSSSPEVPSSGGWAYAFPLLLSQQYHSALSHLAEVGGGTGLLQATHLGIIMYFAGVPLYDFMPTDEQQQEGQGESKQNADDDDDLMGKKLLSKLIVSYANAFQNVDPKIALEYLVRLPDIHSTSSSSAALGTIGQFAKKQIRRLLLETRAFEPLAGKVSLDGSRVSATETPPTQQQHRHHQQQQQQELPALDVYFSSSEVSSMLADAAVDTMREGNKADAAELFALAGKYGSLLTLLNRELASHLVDVTLTATGGVGRNGEQLQQQQESEQRSFWRNAALRFHSLHLAHGRTHVVEVLEKEGNLALGNTFQLLMNLMVFFDRCRDQQWEDAWILIDSLLLLPRTEAEMSRRVEAFHCLDSVLQHSFHHIALSSMECLYHQHSNLKSSLGRGQSASAAGATEQRLMELRGRGRLLVTFAGLIQMRSSADTNARIARMEAYMM